MRLLYVVVAALVAAPSAAAAFGGGPIVFREYTPQGVTSAPEPTIGIPWNTDHVFYHSLATTLRASFDAGNNVTWDDVTPPYQVPLNLDPMLVADEDTGRIFAGGLHGACSVMMISDDDGETWVPGLNMCSGPWFDHQSIGIGPKPVVGNPLNLPHLQNAYYCGQLGQIGCSVSLDGGETWTAPTPHVGECGGFHGHWRISRVTGTGFLPVGDCGSQHGMLATTGVSALTGIQFDGRTIPGSHEWTAGFDPSIGISRDSGWVYYGQADHHGAFIALSKDEGQSWETLPGSDGNASTWVDVGAFHDPPVVAATFADVQAGDDDRAAFTFMGIEWHPGIDLEYVQSDMIFSCGERQDELVWHYYAAFTYDAGHNWTVKRLTDDPVQVGGVYDSLGGHEGGCRNLLDFNDMDIDSSGRVHIGWADGCIDQCAEEQKVGTQGHGTQAPRLFRQVGGQGLFAAHDAAVQGPDLDGDGVPDEEDDDIDGDGVPNDEDDDPSGTGTGTQAPEQDASTLGMLAGLGALVAVAIRRRR